MSGIMSIMSKIFTSSIANPRYSLKAISLQLLGYKTYVRNSIGVANCRKTKSLDEISSGCADCVIFFATSGWHWKKILHMMYRDDVLRAQWNI